MVLLTTTTRETEMMRECLKKRMKKRMRMKKKKKKRGRWQMAQQVGGKSTRGRRWRAEAVQR